MLQAIQAFIDALVGLRKFFVMLIVYGVGIYMKFHGQLSGDQFVNLMKSTTIGFFGANGVEHMSLTARKIFGKSNG